MNTGAEGAMTYAEGMSEPTTLMTFGHGTAERDELVVDGEVVVLGIIVRSH